ncbi:MULTISPECIES: restriction endonuclease subunit S [Pasteurellaceae]|uniref:restriction endonuclease subunit S n=1 Tax=Pasteurellaceae TaxID=712 RepID=UPI0035679468
MSKWATYKLGDCISLVIDNRGKTPPLSNTGYELIEVASITNKKKNPDYTKISKFVSTDTFNSWFRKGHPKCGDILIPTVGSLGNVAILSEDRGCIAQNLIALRAKTEILSPDFLYYFLNDKTIRNKILSLDIGSVQPSLKVPHLLNLKISLPSLEQQEKISYILGNLDEKIELNTQINQTLEQIAQAIFKSWFIDFDPVHTKAESLTRGETEHQANLAAMAVISGKSSAELDRLQTEEPKRFEMLYKVAEAFPSGIGENGLPLGWETKKIGEIAQFVKGKKPKHISENPNNGYLPHILMATISGNQIEYAQIERSVICEITDTLILMDGSASGKVFIGFNGVIGSTLAKMNLANKKYWALLNQYLKYQESDIQAHTTGTSIPHTDKSRVLNYEFIIPSDDLILFFNELLLNSIKKIIENKENSSLLEKIRDELLPKLLGGEIQL